MQKLLKHFPRQLGFPNRVNVKTMNKFLDYVNRYNGIKRVHYSIYNTNKKGRFSNVKIDKLFFDFDGDTAQENAKNLVDYLRSKNLKHLILFSGRKGFHVYVFTKNYENIQRTKDTMYNAQQFLMEEANFECDPSVIGDITQLGRVPNTKHTGSNLYCIPITYEDLKKGKDYIKEKAENQNFNFTYYGSKKFDLTNFDKPSDRKETNVDVEKMEDYEYDIDTDDKMLKHFPPCVKKWLLEPGQYCKNKSRYYFALFCKSIALPPKTCKRIAKKYWSTVQETGGNRSKFQEFIQEKQVEYAYGTDNCVPDCLNLYSQGFCPGQCDKFKENNFPTYVD